MIIRKFDELADIEAVKTSWPITSHIRTGLCTLFAHTLTVAVTSLQVWLFCAPTSTWISLQPTSVMYYSHFVHTHFEQRQVKKELSYRSLDLNATSEQSVRGRGALKRAYRSKSTVHSLPNKSERLHSRDAAATHKCCAYVYHVKSWPNCIKMNFILVFVS